MSSTWRRCRCRSSGRIHRSAPRQRGRAGHVFEAVRAAADGRHAHLCLVDRGLRPTRAGPRARRARRPVDATASSSAPTRKPPASTGPTTRSRASGCGRTRSTASAATRAYFRRPRRCCRCGGHVVPIPYGGRAELQHARDVARQFISSLRATVEGALVLILPAASRCSRHRRDPRRRPQTSGAVGFDDVVGDRRSRAGRHALVRRVARRSADDSAARRRGRDDRELPRAARARPRQARARGASS